jgi:hypothetical protein
MSLLTRVSTCTTRKGTINKISSTKKNLLVIYKGSQWESGNQIVYISNFLGDSAKIGDEVVLPKKFSMIQCTTEQGDPMFTEQNQPVMKFDYLIEE